MLNNKYMLIKKHLDKDTSLYNENVWIGDSVNILKCKNVIYPSGNPKSFIGDLFKGKRIVINDKSILEELIKF